MKIHGEMREFSAPVFGSKKHVCPCCGEKLEKFKTETVVNSSAEEAKDYDFSNGDSYLSGNVNFIGTAFRCVGCGKVYSVKDIKNHKRK